MIAGGPLGGRYAVQSELASGGSARIYLAEDLKLGRPVAVKVAVASVHFQREEGIRRLEREARMAGAINHPNVCAVSDIGKLDDGMPFLVMELLTGETLATCLWREKVLPLRLALDVGEQMLAGIAAAHRRGIIHRDIKPENLFLIELGVGRSLVKVLDFGTAQVPRSNSPHGDELTRFGHVVGTMRYMSPEQLQGLRDFDTRTDVYSCAVVLHEILTGERPFDAVPDAILAERIAFTRPPPIRARHPHLPEAVAQVVDEALSVDRMRRPVDAGALLSALRAARQEMELLRSGRGRGGYEDAPTRQVSARDLSSVGEDTDWDLPTVQRGSVAVDEWDDATAARRQLSLPSAPETGAIEIELDIEPDAEE